MNKINSLADWKFTRKISDEKRMVSVTIHFKYPDVKTLIPFSLAERRLKIRQALKKHLANLLKTGLIETHTLIGSKIKPRGIKTEIPYTHLSKLSKLSYIQTVFINNMSHARRITTAAPNTGYFCVKMTVAIEIEGKNKGMQTLEERFVLIKAKDFEDAYRKIERTKKSYAQPYLNTKGELVSWKIESLDDCYETFIASADDLNQPEGVEVYSKLKSRKMK